MSHREKVEEIFGKAQVLEKKYDWVKGIVLYEQALRAVGKRDFLKRREIQERIGYCFYRAAFQAETQEEFRRRMGLSVDAYEEAAMLFERLEDSKRQARINFCMARASYNRSWLVEGSSERKALLNECWKLEKGALKVFEEAGDRLGHGKLCNELLYCLYDRSLIEWNGQQLNKIVREAVGYGETAIEILSEVRDEQELARAYSMTSLHCFYAANTSELEEKRKEFSQKCLSYAKKALELSEKVGDSYLSGLSNWAAATGALYFSGNMASSLEHAEKMLQQGMTIQDNYVMGVACYQLASTTNWMMKIEEDPDKKREGYSKAIRYAEDAIRHLRIIANDYFIAETPLAKSYILLAFEVETNREEKRILLKRAVEAGRKSLEHAERSGSPDAIGANLHELSKALYSLSNMETKISEKKKLLEEASKHRQDYINIVERMYPSNYWVRGVGQTYQALIKAELAKIDPEKEEKRRLLEEAASNMDNCLKLIEKWAKLYPQTRIFAVLGKYYDRFGGILNQLCWLTEDEEVLKRAIEAYEKAVDTYGKAELPSRLAEAHWNIAKLYDRLGEYVKASENFESAADAYKASAEKIQRLNDFYSDYATYMQAWSAIEKAKHSHIIEEYSQSKVYYEKAANICKALKLWDYLAPKYLAWAHLEHGEDLSRKEKSKEAKQAFQQAAKLFSEAKGTLEETSLKIESNDEKEKTLALSKAAETRQEYCKGRILLEEARIHDRESNTLLSAETYSLATKVFQKVAEALEEESERKELYPIIYFCQAWEKMKLAEQRVTPALFMESSKLFIKAKEHSTKEKTSLLAMGNSALCKALEAGTRFEATRDLKLYSTAKRNMESAANYYLKAGFEKASTWVNANQALLDAYIYMSKAETETIHEEKIRQYKLAEKYLERSAKLYEKAGYTGKRDEVLKVLAKVREKREFALSLSDALKPPTLASNTTVFSVPTSTQEEAVGLERFEHADIQAYLSAPEEVTAGEEFELRIDLANVARESGLLVRIDELIPETFKVTKTPTPYIIEGKSLNAKGKQIAPHKVESIKISAQATQSGVFQLCPEVIYVDDLGKFKRFKCDAVPITTLPPSGFQFKTDNAQKVFEYLTKAFIEDYMKRRLALEKSGWRTLVQIKENAKVPKSSVYGTIKRRGYAISELETRGLVETRIFPGERGRGGRIIKARIFYEKETIKRHIDQHIMKIKEK